MEADVSGRVLRHEVPVDDRWHALQLSGPIVHVASRNPRSVEVWAIATAAPSVTRGFRAFGTGQALPPDVQHVGTAVTAGGQLVWHLFEALGRTGDPK